MPKDRIIVILAALVAYFIVKTAREIYFTHKIEKAIGGYLDQAMQLRKEGKKIICGEDGKPKIVDIDEDEERSDGI